MWRGSRVHTEMALANKAATITSIRQHAGPAAFRKSWIQADVVVINTMGQRQESGQYGRP